MNQQSLDPLITGYRRFLARYSSEQYLDYRTKASKKQSPKVMMISCSDSRINPGIITDAGLGTIFTLTNIANLVPSCREAASSHCSTAAALEYAVNILKVEHIIILGHSNCGGIRALMQASNQTSDSYIQNWMLIASPAKKEVITEYAERSFDQQVSLCERASLRISLDNLHSFPWIADAVEQGRLSTHAWHFDIKTGAITTYEQQKAGFVSLIKGS